MVLRKLKIAVVAGAVVVIGLNAPERGPAVASPPQAAQASNEQTIETTGRFHLRYTRAVALGADGRVYVLDYGSGRSKVMVTVYSPSGKGVDRWSVDASDDVSDLAVDSADNVYVASQIPRRILKYSPNGRLLAKLQMPGTDFANVSIAVDPAGRLIAAHEGLIVVFDAAGRLATQRQVIAPENRVDYGVLDVAVTDSGAVFVSTPRGIARLDLADGALRYVARAGGRPQDVAGDTLAAGPANTVYVLASAASIPRIQRYAADGSYLGSLGLDRHSAADDIAVTSDALILVLQSGTVRVLAPITTIDITPPTINIRSLRTRPAGRTSSVAARLRYTLSETAAARLAFRRREERGRYRGEYRHMETIDVPPGAAGTHTFDWRARSAKAARLRRGTYRVFMVAWDSAGLQSSTARASFELTRR